MARTDEKLEHLKQVPLFSQCSRKDLETIGRESDEISVEAGRVLIEEGKPGHEFFLILEGSASVHRRGQQIATLGPGKFFGELSLLDGGPRTATVKAETPMELLVLGTREFAGLLDSVPGLAHTMLGAVATRLRNADLAAFE